YMHLATHSHENTEVVEQYRKVFAAVSDLLRKLEDLFHANTWNQINHFQPVPSFGERRRELEEHIDSFLYSVMMEGPLCTFKYNVNNYDENEKPWLRAFGPAITVEDGNIVRCVFLNTLPEHVPPFILKADIFLGVFDSFNEKLWLKLMGRNK